MNFNLPAPPNFRGLDPQSPLRRYERILPHWRQERATYFVTFHLADAMPAAKRRELQAMRREWELRNPPPRDEQVWQDHARAMLQFIEDVLDTGAGRCWFTRDEYASEVQRSILHFHDKRYEFGCSVVMANHCHLTMRPFRDFELEDLIGGIKRTTAHYVNEHEGLAGTLWQPESYDRIIRDEEHLHRVAQYIGRNPHQAGVPRRQWCRWINPEWVAAGWNFEPLGDESPL